MAHILLSMSLARKSASTSLMGCLLITATPSSLRIPNRFLWPNQQQRQIIERTVICVEGCSLSCVALGEGGGRDEEVQCGKVMADILDERHIADDGNSLLPH